MGVTILPSKEGFMMPLNHFYPQSGWQDLQPGPGSGLSLGLAVGHAGPIAITAPSCAWHTCRLGLVDAVAQQRVALAGGALAGVWLGAHSGLVPVAGRVAVNLQVVGGAAARGAWGTPNDNLRHTVLEGG